MALKACMTGLALAVASVSFGVQAQTGNDVIELSEWDYQTLYEQGGLQAETLLGSEVLGPEGDEIGSIENVIIGDNNQIVAIIAQVGGFWDLGDTHIAVPWEEVDLTGEGVAIPVTEDNLDEYGLFDSEFITQENLQQVIQVDSDVATGRRSWKLSELLDDYATLRGESGYGYIDNVIFSEDGEVQAVVVVVYSAARYGRGAYAYPFYGYDHGWDPAYDVYELPYEESDIVGLDTFDYDRFNDILE